MGAGAAAEATEDPSGSFLAATRHAAQHVPDTNPRSGHRSAMHGRMEGPWLRSQVLTLDGHDRLGEAG
jgi:hypothetical protein